MDNKRLFLAALLSVSVLLLWQTFFPVEGPAPGARDGSPGVLSEAPTDTGLGRREEPREASPEAVSASPPRASDIESEATEDAVAAEVSASSEETVSLETEEFEAVLTNRGAQLISFVLKEHSNGGGGGVDLVKKRQNLPDLFGLTDSTGTSDPLNDALFVTTSLPDRGLGRKFSYSGPLGVAEKEFRVRPDGLLEIHVSVPGRSDWALYLGPGLRNPSIEELESRFSRRTVASLQEGKVEREDVTRVKEALSISGINLSWVGLEDNYFTVIWVASGPLDRVRVRPIQGRTIESDEEVVFVPAAAAEEDDELSRELELLIYPGEETLDGLAYLGAKRYDKLAELPFNLKQAVNLGFFAVLARPLLAGLGWIHDNLTGNYGWAIILMTILIRLVLFPLTHKSFVSMQKMQELNPKIQAVRSKYRGKLKDKQGRPNTEMQRKMNDEVMAMYRQEGVNPAGGCLPMLLQIPVLFAFYNLLSAAVELRHAPWLLWINDLSAPDPIYVLPIVMGASQFVQQRITPSAADPMQRRIFMLMPFFFTILFLGFPSGLVLYWLTNNLLGIVQQVGYKRLRAAKEPVKESAKGLKNKK